MQAFINSLKASEFGMAVPYAHNYTAYVVEDQDRGGYFISYCEGEMPPHETGRAATAEEAAAKLAEIADLSRAYAIEAE